MFVYKIFQDGHCLNDLQVRIYDTDIFVDIMREASALQKLLTFFRQKILANLRY